MAEQYRPLFEQLVENECYEEAALCHRHMLALNELTIKQLALQTLGHNRMNVREVEALEKRLAELQELIVPTSFLEEWQMEMKEMNELALTENERKLSKLTMASMISYIKNHQHPLTDHLAQEFMILHSTKDLKLIARATIEIALQMYWDARRDFFRIYYHLSFLPHLHSWRMAVKLGVNAITQVFYFILRTKARFSGKWSEQRRVLQQPEVKKYLEGKNFVSSFTCFFFKKK